MAELLDSLSGRTRFAHLCAEFNNILSRPEATSDVICGAFVGPNVLNKCVKFHVACLNRSRETPREAVGGGIIDGFFRENFRPEEDNDVISGTAVDNVGVDNPVKFGDSGSNSFRDIRGADFVSNE